MPKTSVGDIETTGWDRAEVACTLDDAGNLETWEGPGCLERMSEHMDRVKGNFGFHGGGIFDTLLVSNVRDAWEEIVLSGSAVLLARDGNLRVRDTYRAWQKSLRDVGKAIEKQEADKRAKGFSADAPGRWLKKDVDRRRIRLLTAKEKREYCASDCEILLEAIMRCHAYLESHGARVTWTSGSSALALLEAIEPQSWRLLRRFAIPFDDALRGLEAPRGGWTERYAHGRVDRVYCYDRKSAYPASYADTMLPLGLVDAPPDGPLLQGSAHECEWIWPHRSRIPPARDSATGAGFGLCRNWLVAKEIRAFERCGVKVRRLRGFNPRVLAPIGQDFVRTLYAEKEEGSFFAKTYINSLHGKTQEHPLREAYSGREPPDPAKLWMGIPATRAGPYWRWLSASCDDNGNAPRHCQPLAAATILGNARVELWEIDRAVEDAGGRVHYNDTDSIHCSLSPAEMPASVKLGTGLGELNFEKGPVTGYYLSPKGYCLVDEATGEIKGGALKGVPWAGLKDGVREGNATIGYRYRESSDAEADADRGEDLRLDVFRQALADPRGVRVQKGGITSFRVGLASGRPWEARQLERTITPIWREKRYSADGLSWEYLSADEIRARQIATVGELAQMPLAIMDDSDLE